ncbi:MAG: hypothetical protein R8M45_03710 [Ghiorsea sp.]
MSTLTILNELASDKGKLFKVAVLNANKDDELLKEVFFATYDTFTHYYIKQIPPYVSSRKSTLTLEEALSFLKDDIASRKITGDEAKQKLASVLSELSEDDAEVLSRVIQRDLRVGCSASTANKVWKNLISTYPCMLCAPFNEKNIDKINYPAIIQTKMDGARVNFIIENGEVSVYSRSGKPIDLNGYLSDDALNIAACYGEDCVIDGELLVVDANGDYCSRKEGNGIINKAGKGLATDEQCAMVRCVAWDIISFDEFKNEVGNQPYCERFNLLSACIESDSSFKITETRTVVSLSEAKTFYNRMLANGCEGAVLKNSNSIWENRRSRNQVKLKVEKELDLRIVGLSEGKGEITGILGAFELESEDGLLVVSAGTGLSLAQREEYWDDSLIGTIVTIKGNEVINSKGKTTKSIFLPVFIELRSDKNMANTINEIESFFENGAV